MSESNITLSPEILICGLRIRILAMETTRSKWNTLLIGARPGRYLIFDMPKVNNIPVKLDDGSRWAVNFISHGQIFTFYSEVIGSSFRPVPIVFFSYPDVVEISNLRNDKRYPVNIPVTIETTTDSPPLLVTKGLILDLSWGGCLAASTVEIPAEVVLNMTIYLDNTTNIEGIQVEKKSSRNKQGTYYTGLSFLPTNPVSVTDRIGELITEIESIPLRI
ncbi:MAG: flagellar brake protein [Deltaproteobacteria bacterium]|jgi:c-di-GMP-binding flagellar brake protein YcgR|nr:flagellar brake protein [Deltaproteobacteria bacterium]